MGVEHLQGKRTGRPRGSKSRPWLRAIRWACRHVDRPDAVPPSPLAGYYLALGREHPDRFLACLAALDEKTPTEPETEDRARSTDRLKQLFWPLRQLVFRLSHLKGAHLTNLPRDYEIVDCRMNRTCTGVIFTIRSGTFPEVAEGALIPDFTPNWNGLMWARPQPPRFP
jgi:hypothetical protein